MQVTVIRIISKGLDNFIIDRLAVDTPFKERYESTNLIQMRFKERCAEIEFEHSDCEWEIETDKDAIYETLSDTITNINQEIANLNTYKDTVIDSLLKFRNEKNSNKNRNDE